MKLVIEKQQGVYSVREHQGDFRGLAGVKDNGQHLQLPGAVLAELRVDENFAISLYHPETNPQTGHTDVTVARKDGRYVFRRYAEFREFFLDDRSTVEFVWPTGADDLVRVVDAIEHFLESRLNYKPRLHGEIIAAFAARSRQQAKMVMRSAEPVQEPVPA